MLSFNGLGTAPDRCRRSPCASSAPGGTRTPNPRFRRPMLYPIELRAQTIRFQYLAMPSQTCQPGEDAMPPRLPGSVQTIVGLSLAAVKRSGGTRGAEQRASCFARGPSHGRHRQVAADTSRDRNHRSTPATCVGGTHLPAPARMTEPVSPSLRSISGSTN